MSKELKAFIMGVAWLMKGDWDILIIGFCLIVLALMLCNMALGIGTVLFMGPNGP